jgi:uncharacterized protein YjbI with pentapeptide repeats
MPKPPIISFAAPPILTDANALRLRAGESREGERFSDADLTDFDLTGSSFLDCEFDSVTFTGAQLRASRFVETVISASFAPTLVASRTTWREVQIVNPRWGSAELYDSELGAVHLRGGKIDYLNLRSSTLTSVLIEDCTIGELDLAGVRADRVAFRNCRIGTLDIGGARCANVDLRGSDFEAIKGLEGLRGVTISEEQLAQLAPVLAAHVGLIVE